MAAAITDIRKPFPRLKAAHSVRVVSTPLTDASARTPSDYLVVARAELGSNRNQMRNLRS